MDLGQLRQLQEMLNMNLIGELAKMVDHYMKHDVSLMDR